MGFLTLNRDVSFSKIAVGGIGWSKIGYNDDVDNVDEDLIVQGGSYSWPAAATKMDIVSDDAADKGTATAGTGARTVTLHYLDSTGAEKSEILTMAGATPVTTSGTVWRVQNLRVSSVGSSNKPVGNLTLSEVGGTSNVYGYIRAGYTRMRQCTWTVPTGKELYINYISVSAVNAAISHWCRFTFRATYDEKSRTVLSPNFFIPYHEFMLMDATLISNMEIATMLPAGTDFKMSALSDASNANEKCACELRGYLITL
jgi:hypothetical protein